MSKLIRHHPSYFFPEVTELVPDSIHRKLPKQKSTTKRGFFTSKIHPFANTLYISKPIRNELGCMVEIYLGTSCAMVIPYNTSLKDIERSLRIALNDIRFRREREEEEYESKS